MAKHHTAPAPAHSELSFQQRGLYQQGFQRYAPCELRELEWGLRFTPLMCSLAAAYGLYSHSPFILFAVAALGIWAFVMPAAHPMDLLYNHGVRHFFGLAALPANPFQRRLACLAAAVMNAAAGILFIAGLPLIAWGVGITLLVLQFIVITTHFCTLSWMYEGLMRALGKWQMPASDSEIAALLAPMPIT